MAARSCEVVVRDDGAGSPARGAAARRRHRHHGHDGDRGQEAARCMAASLRRVSSLLGDVPRRPAPRLDDAVDVLRVGDGQVPWPRARASGMPSPHLHGSAIVFCLVGFVSRATGAQASRSPCRRHRTWFSQEAFMNPIMTGLEDVGGDPAVRNACQPPAAGGPSWRGGRPASASHRDHVHLEAALLEQTCNRPEVGEHGEVGGVHQHDRRAVVARFTFSSARDFRSSTPAAPPGPWARQLGEPHGKNALQTL